MDAVISSQPVRSVFNLLRFTYGVVPVVAGLDKFTNLLTNWEGYLSPRMVEMVPFSPDVFMMIVGVIEILAGILVFIKPSIGAYVVAAWLTLIAITLLIGGHFFDVAVRDLVMAAGAFSLAKLSRLFDKKINI
jgi:uncharacterized membrane protein YphA (DoxX/SURF4 family)